MVFAVRLARAASVKITSLPSIETPSAEFKFMTVKKYSLPLSSE